MKRKDLLCGLPGGVKASIALFVSNIITKGIAYITMPIYTRLLTSEQYGQSTVFFTWMQVFGIVAMFCLSAGVFNNGMIDYPEKRDEFSFSMLALSNVITVIFAILLLVFYPFVSKYVRLDVSLLIMMCIVFFFQPAYNFWVSRQRYELKYKATFIMSVIAAIISPTIAIASISFFENKLYGRIFGAELPLVIMYIFFFIYIMVKGKFKVNVSYWKFALKFNLPLIPHYLSTYLLTSADALMISYLIGEAATAYYSVAYSVAAVVTIVWTAVNGSLVPFTYENCKRKNYQAINKVTLPILSLFAFCCIGVILFAPEVIFFMATKEYAEAIYVIPPIVGGVFFQAQYYIYSNIVYYYKRPLYVMLGSVTAVVINIVLNYVFIGRFGYIAAGYTTLLCYIVQAVIDYFAMRHVVGENVYDMKYIVKLSVIIIVLSVLSNLIYDFWIVRYSILAVACIVLIIMRKKVIGILGIMKKKTEETTD